MEEREGGGEREQERKRWRKRSNSRAHQPHTPLVDPTKLGKRQATSHSARAKAGRRVPSLMFAVCSCLAAFCVCQLRPSSQPKTEAHLGIFSLSLSLQQQQLPPLLLHLLLLFSYSLHLRQLKHIDRTVHFFIDNPGYFAPSQFVSFCRCVRPRAWLLILNHHHTAPHRTAYSAK